MHARGAGSGPSRPFIVVTGCNGVGKTTVAESLRERLDAALFHYPAEFVEFRQRVSLDTAVSGLPRLLYYLGATLHLSDLVREELTGRPVICDRYLESPASLLIAESALPPDEVERFCAQFRSYLRAPDVTLLLTAAYDTACTRIRERRPARSTRVERLVLDSPDFFRRREEALRDHAARLGPVVELETTGLGVPEMCRSAGRLVGLG